MKRAFLALIILAISTCAFSATLEATLDWAGTDSSGTFTTDIIGTTRSSWDIGAFEYVAAGGNKWNTIIPSKWNGVNWADMDWNK